MQITLDITPEAQVELSRQATASGRDPEAHAATLLEQALHVPSANSLRTMDDPAFGKRLVETFATIRGLADDLDFSRDPSPGRSVELS